jgi:hypothetical protein
MTANFGGHSRLCLLFVILVFTHVGFGAGIGWAVVICRGFLLFCRIAHLLLLTTPRGVHPQ